MPVAAAGYERDYENGLLVQAGGDSMMGTVGAYPGGGIMGLEQFVSYDGERHAIRREPPGTTWTTR